MMQRSIAEELEGIGKHAAGFQVRRAERDGSNPELFRRQPQSPSRQAPRWFGPKIIFRNPVRMRLRLSTLLMTSRSLFCASAVATGLFGVSLAALAQAPAAPAASPAASPAP